MSGLGSSYISVGLRRILCAVFFGFWTMVIVENKDHSSPLYVANRFSL